ncbi:unnamed protein product [Litomosoides sigmodontis]|uniref:Uncharacterized protein n=1 Tax=Litomosoides sigmodontis TaxID=42156 RepID=A0A3P6SWJ3_LITSI|nr:unnamed protein product [Litomosoides sigmodontis]
MEQRDMKAQRMHVNIVNSVEQLNSLKSSYNDTERRKLDLKAKEVELEDLQQFSEMRRNIINEQIIQFELLKIAEVANKEKLG